jgi:hypothetical protein
VPEDILQGAHVLKSFKLLPAFHTQHVGQAVRDAFMAVNAGLLARGQGGSMLGISRNH